MLTYLFRRLGEMLVTLLGVSVVVFASARLSGDPVSLMVGPSATQRQIETLRHQMHLDRPVLQQYLGYLSGMLHGHFGDSLRQHQPVTTLILQRLPATLELATAAMVLIVAISIPAGALCSINRGSRLDRSIVGLASLGQAMPAFWAGPLFILVFAVELHWLPSFGRGGFAQLVLPAATLAIISVALSTRLVRSEVADGLARPFSLAARARGASTAQVTIRHAGRYAAPQVMTLFGLQLGYLLGGTVITETIFAWPGLGQLVIQALNQRDYPLVQGVVMFMAATFIVINTAVDIGYTLLDPRIRLISGRA